MLKDERCKAYLINGAHSTEKQNVSAFQLHSLQNALDIWLESTFLVHGCMCIYCKSVTSVHAVKFEDAFLAYKRQEQFSIGTT